MHTPENKFQPVGEVSTENVSRVPILSRILQAQIGGERIDLRHLMADRKLGTDQQVIQLVRELQAEKLIDFDHQKSSFRLTDTFAALIHKSVGLFDDSEETSA